jgi:hypothetical protein
MIEFASTVDDGSTLMTLWEFKGRELVNCSCDYGCNCQFNGLPDKGHCHAVAGIQIDEGRHGETSLDGLRVAAIFKWPGPTKCSATPCFAS